MILQTRRQIFGFVREMMSNISGDLFVIMTDLAPQSFCPALNPFLL
jgi:hypothetical protein